MSSKECPARRVRPVRDYAPCWLGRGHNGPHAKRPEGPYSVPETWADADAYFEETRRR